MGHLLTFWNNYIRRYKYVVAFLVFMLIIGVVDENSLLVRYHRRVDISNLKREIDKYQQQYDEESARLQSLMNNPAAVEKLAREKYLMKRAEEDVFVIVDSTSTD
ncbi:MAG: septum formation initiator family protein [Bacteroidaceae bacterium]|nr:septum formation initiator family protein [Bacteroidaceae bacterium]